MNISPVSNNLGFGKLHIEKTEDNKNFVTMLCANKMAAPAREFAVMDWVSGNNDIYLEAQRTNSDRIEFDVKISSDKAPFAWETFVPSNSGDALKKLNNQISKYYYDLDKNASEATPEQLLNLYS